MKRKRVPLEVRFLKKVKKIESGCWIFLGAQDSRGYGKIGEGGRFGKTTAAHRVSYQIHYGPIPDGKFVLHSCDVPLCVNPAHLWLGTQKENIHDCISKGRNHCLVPTKLFGEDHPRHKLTADQVRAIRESVESQAKIAMQFGITQSQVSRIKRGIHWIKKH